MSRQGKKKFVLLAVSLLFALAIGEVAARAIDLNRTKFRRSFGEEDLYIYDRKIYYRLCPGRSWGKNSIRINARGYRTPEFSREKPGGVRRIICLGESCTFGWNVDQPFPQLLQELLDKKAAGTDWEVINAGVPGYTIYHGKIAFRELLEFRPDIVTLYYGWNDFWITRDIPFPELERMARSSNPLWKLELARMVSRGLHFLSTRGAGGKANYAVPLEYYRQNLEEIIEECTGRGIRVVLLTAPSCLKGDYVPDWLVQKGFAQSKEDVVALWESYNNAVREVAARTSAELLDVSSDFLTYTPQEVFLDPENDPVHPNQKGHSLIAGELADLITGGGKQL